MRTALASLAILILSNAAGQACDVAGLKLEETIAARKELRDPANEQTVRDLRTLRDAAIILDTYKHEAECERLLAIVLALSTDPGKAIEQSGDTDEEKAEAIEESRVPKTPAAPK